MDFELTTEQAELKEGMRSFCEGRFPMAVVRGIEDALMRQYLGQQVPASQVSQADFDRDYKALADSLGKQNKTLDQFFKESGQDAAILRRDIIAKLQWRILLTRFFPETKAKRDKRLRN